MAKVTVTGTVGQIVDVITFTPPARLEDLMIGLDREPHDAYPLIAGDAWWYEAKDGIKVYMECEGHTLACRIHLRDLQDYVRRATEANAERRAISRLKRGSTGNDGEGVTAGETA